MLEATIVLLVFLLALALGIPVVAALAGAAFIGVWLLTGAPISVVAQRVVAQVSSPVLVAVPLFVLMANLLVAGGITRRLFDLAAAAVGHIRGGLAQINVITSVFMGGLSGSSSADAAMDSRTIVPEMIRRGYPAGFAGAVTAASSTLSIIFPPSIAMIIYASLSDASVGELFVAGLLPGFALSALFIVTVAWICWRQRLGDRHPRPDRYWREVLKAAVIASPAAIIPVAIIGGIRLGFVTPTESAAVGCMIALILGLFVYRELKLRDLPKILKDTAVMTGAVMLIIGAAAPFSWYLGVERVPQQLAASIGSVADATTFMLAATLLVLVAGMVLDATALLILVTPLLAPVAASFGVHPVHFAIIIILTTVVANISPPMGQMVFVVSAIARIPIEGIFRSVLWFIPPIVVLILVVLLFPSPILATVEWLGP